MLIGRFVRRRLADQRLIVTADGALAWQTVPAEISLIRPPAPVHERTLPGPEPEERRPKRSPSQVGVSS